MKNLPFSIRHSAFSVKRVGAPWGVSGAWTPPFRLPRILQAFARRQPGDLKLTPAVNHGTGGQVGLFGAANEIRVDGEWVQVTPKGEFPNVVGLQVVDDEALRLMTSEFKTIAAKMANRFRGVPFYVGHPDAEDPEDREIDPRYGKAKVARGLELEARNDGLWARMKPNAAGTEIIENGYFDFLSPYWGMMAIPGRPKAFRPAVLWSVGFTNNPQIPGLPVGKNNKQKETTNMPQWLIDLLVAAKVLKPAANEATEDEVKGAVKGLLELPAKLNRRGRPRHRGQRKEGRRDSARRGEQNRRRERGEVQGRTETPDRSLSHRRRQHQQDQGSRSAGMGGEIRQRFRRDGESDRSAEAGAERRFESEEARSSPRRDRCPG